MMLRNKNVSQHIDGIFEDGELSNEATHKKFLLVQTEGKRQVKREIYRELLERVRSIRASERRIWQQITDIFAECSIDYNKNSQITRDFYAMVQNKFHFAIAG